MHTLASTRVQESTLVLAGTRVCIVILVLSRVVSMHTTSMDNMDNMDNTREYNICIE